MTIKYQGLNITQPIQGKIQAEAFSVDLLNASTTQGSLSLEEQAAQLHLKQNEKKYLKKCYQNKMQLSKQNYRPS